jgi:class 3 adenylate cyclase
MWLLVVPLLSLVAAAAVVGAVANLAAGERTVPFTWSGAQGPTGYPFAPSLRTSLSEVQRGDLLIRIGDADLRGLSSAQVGTRIRPILAAGEPFEVELERDGQRFTTTLTPVPNPTWWWPWFAWIALVGVGILLLIRAPDWHLAQVFFLNGSFWAIHGLMEAHGLLEPWAKTLQIAALASAYGTSLWFFFRWNEHVPVGRRLAAIVIALPILAAVSETARHLLALPTGNWPMRSTALCSMAFVALSLGALVRAYRRSTPLERRKLRWICYGHFVGMVPIVLAIQLELLLPAFGLRTYAIAWAAVSAIPLGYAIAIIGYGWLDIDRVITASAAATVVGVGLVSSVLVIVPAAARAAGNVIGGNADTFQIVFSMAFAAVLVPAYRALRPWLDRRLFAERYELTQRFVTLRSEIGSSRGVEEMATRVGEGFDALLRPESVAIYGRAGEAFAPLFVRGQGAVPAFEADSMLARVLQTRAKPLFARDRDIEPFERAALDTLGAEVVVPQLREKQLVAFTCLGAKRSGDIYTAGDLALLRSVAERCSEVIERIDAETLLREAQSMQSALRRYVPGAVAERILQGDTLEPTEREVSVLFVDIRGYTALAAGLEVSDVFATLNEHTERVSRILQECGGTIVEFNGDGMMAVFGAPEPLARKELNAVEAARRIVDSMPPHLAVGIGIATGTVFVGSIRSSDRLIWSAVGSTTNLAARLQGMTREIDASIAIDDPTRTRAGYVCTDFVAHRGLPIRGRAERFDVFALPAAAALAAG